MSMPLLMIPGPVEVSHRVLSACSLAPASHLAPAIIEAFGGALELMRRVWLAPASAQPFIVPGSGTTVMEMVAQSLLDPGDEAVVVWTGYFSERIAEMLRRRGVTVTVVQAEPGEVPSSAEVERALDAGAPRALFVTHVDTSTGVRADARAFAGLAKARGILSVFDGVCATAGERFEMEAWGADVYLTASQKAIGLPAGLGLLVASERAMDARKRLRTTPPLSVDFESWVPIMRAYEERRPSYFATPPTTLVRALLVGLEEILEQGVEARFAEHARAADGMRAAWRALGLSLLPKRLEITANTLSAILLPEGIGPELVGEIAKRGVIVAGGLLPALRTRYFRVGHMGAVLARPDALRATVEAVGEALAASGRSVDVAGAVAALER